MRSLREVFNILTAHAGGDDGLNSAVPGLTEDIEEILDTVGDMFSVIDDHIDNLIREWNKTRGEDDRLFDSEENAYIGGSKLMGYNRQLPLAYISQGEDLAND